MYGALVSYIVLFGRWSYYCSKSVCCEEQCRDESRRSVFPHILAIRSINVLTDKSSSKGPNSYPDRISRQSHCIYRLGSYATSARIITFNTARIKPDLLLCYGEAWVIANDWNDVCAMRHSDQGCMFETLFRRTDSLISAPTEQQAGCEGRTYGHWYAGRWHICPGKMDGPVGTCRPFSIQIK